MRSGTSLLPGRFSEAKLSAPIPRATFQWNRAGKMPAPLFLRRFILLFRGWFGFR